MLVRRGRGPSHAFFVAGSPATSCLLLFVWDIIGPSVVLGGDFVGGVARHPRIVVVVADGVLVAPLGVGGGDGGGAS